MVGVGVVVGIATVFAHYDGNQPRWAADVVQVARSFYVKERFCLTKKQVIFYYECYKRPALWFALQTPTNGGTGKIVPNYKKSVST